jgi:hypothetical protein
MKYSYFELQKQGKTSESGIKRLKNIQFIENLKGRESLKNGIKERRLLIYNQFNNDNLYIQYPGRESVRKKAKPWDFKPALILSNGEIGKDLTFEDIWQSFYEIIYTQEKSTSFKHAVNLLATTFYRMAYMIDHKPYVGHIYFEDIDLMSSPSICVNQGQLAVDTLYTYSPPKIIIETIKEEIPKIADIPLETFLFYNDLLAWNEDCKYYYTNLINSINKNQEEVKLTGKKKAIPWIGPIGRINNLMTHFAVLLYLNGEVSFGRLTYLFSQGRGVPKLTNEQILKLIESVTDKKNNMNELKEATQLAIDDF